MWLGIYRLIIANQLLLMEVGCGACLDNSLIVDNYNYDYKQVFIGENAAELATACGRVLLEKLGEVSV